MKNILFVFFIIVHLSVYAQKSYWQQEVNVKIIVSLNDKDYTLDGFESIEYINNSPDTLKFLWFHIWPNAYKNDRTAFSEQLLRDGRTDFYFSKSNQKGYINQLNFKADGTTATMVVDSSNIDIVQVILPKALPPGKKTIITTPFKVKLPYNFSRGGHVGNDYQVTQWYPKPAVYDRKGWHSMPYLDQGEFYNEFGKYDVEITLPSAYVVAATGVLQEAKTLEELRQKGKHSVEANTKTWHFKENNIHDFAWFASKDFIARYDTVMLTSKKVIDVFSFYKPKSKGWDESINYAKDALRKYSKWLGDYPYSTASIVRGSKNENSGGMEYPTITLITVQEAGQELDVTIAHELGHNWFYGVLATNERKHPWMDEGMNTFYHKKYELDKYKSFHHLKDVPFGKKSPEEEEQMLLATMAKIFKDQPIETPADKFTSTNYALIAYYKTSIWMKKLQEVLGDVAFDKAMQDYYNEWKFKHPYPEDFKANIEKSSGKNLDQLFQLLYSTGAITMTEKKSIKPSFIFNLKETDKYNYINISPAVGYNNYDKGMFGAMIHNYQLPLNKLHFIGGVLYGNGSKKLNGFGRASYNIYKKSYHFRTAISYINYSQRDFLTDDNTRLIMQVRRVVPSATLTFFDRDIHSTRRFTMQWKTFYLKEGELNFKTINTPAGPVDEVGVRDKYSYINRLSLGMHDDRVLFPYSFTLSADQGKEFVRTSFTGKYYFNYADGKSGMSARLFAGKFFYLKSKTSITQFNNDRYLLNLSAPKGYEDYTYSDYFVGRNEFEGWMSQQVMERDGFFKVNTELNFNKIGKTDDWLMALNLATDLPDKINPLSVLPFRLPIKIFADIGTYAEAWKNNPASGRFVYDAGLQLSLFSSLLNIYVPIIYSKVYSDYYKSTITENRFMKTISFNINISQLKVQDVIKDIPL